MGDGRAKQAFPLSPLHIDMNPLMIACKVGEMIDPLLVNRYPLGDPKFLSNILTDGTYTVIAARHMCPPAPLW
jgi:hypothetical protein